MFCSLTRSTHPSVKQAACLWLLAVVKQCISQSQVIRLCPLFQLFIKEMEFKAVIKLISMRILKYFEKGIQSCHETNNSSFKVTSATMECVNFVLQYVDTKVLALLVPKLVDIIKIKNNPSIVSKAGAAHVVTSLTSQCPLDLQAFTGKLLSAFLSGLSDRNPAVRMNYAGCIGHLVRTAKDSSKEKLFAKL